MLRLPERATWLRWLYLSQGWLVLAAAPLIVPQMALRTVLAAPVFLSFFTAWGLKRQRGWSRWTGITASALLLLGFPWLTPIGALGLFLILRHPRQVESPPPAEDFWDSERQSLFGAILSIVGFVGAMECLRIYQTAALRIGLPGLEDLQDFDAPAWLALALLVGGTIVHAAVHECGHALAAWAAGYRFKAIRVGPVMLCLDPQGGRRVRFEWKRLFSGGGYLGAVPLSERNVRAKEVCVVAAGPLTSLATGGVLYAALFWLPGTALAPFWLSLAIMSVQGFYMGILSLIPSGYTDGTMLLHLICRTVRGEELIARILSASALDHANQRRRAGDHESTVALRRAALDGLKKAPVPNPLQLAMAHSLLGLAELAVGSFRAAEANFRESLSLMPGGVEQQPIEADCHIGLHRVYLLEHRPDDAALAYQSALRALVKLRDRLPAGTDRWSLQTGLAELHVSAGAFEPALAVIEPALASLSRGSKHFRLRGLLLRFRAQCELQLGQVEHGKATVETAAAWWRSAPGAAQTEAPQEIGLLALALWRAGHTDPAIALLRECIGLFEQRGERNGAARQRLLLAEILWRDWRATEAAEALPDPAALDGELRKHFLEQRAAIHQKAGRLEDALADYREILRQAEAGPQVEEAAIAVARGTLAEACLDTGNLEEAESLARDAWDWLSAANHPEAAGICVTLAVISWNRQRSVSGWIDEGLRRIEETSSLIVPATKARFLETTAVRLEKAGLPGEAARCRLAADGHWESLGLPAKFAVAQAFPACVV